MLDIKTQSSDTYSRMTDKSLKNCHQDSEKWMPERSI